VIDACDAVTAALSTAAEGLSRGEMPIGAVVYAGVPLVLAVTLEPCLMCLGAAITLGVDHVFYALESPNDGAAGLLDLWNPPVEQPFFRRPTVIRGGVQRTAAQELFAQYADGDGPGGMRGWCRGLARS
jgi:tRNA(adenine34) deaminase